MLTLPDEYNTLFEKVRPCFSRRVWPRALLLAVGAILAPGSRTVAAILRIMGRSQEADYQNYHRVLNRAVWSSRALSALVVRLLVATFVPRGPLVMGIDETIERRRGAQIAAKGIYRDPVRSSKSHFVKTSGLRWVSLMLLAWIPWAQRVWGLPFLTVLAPSERYYAERARGPKKLTDWARQMGHQVRRWFPQRAIVLVGDRSYAALELLSSLQHLSPPVHMVTQLRLDAALYEPAPEYPPGQRPVGRPRKKGARLPSLRSVLADPHTVWQYAFVNDWYGQGPTTVALTSATAVWYHGGKPPVPGRWVLVRDPAAGFATRAIFCTDVTAAPLQILHWFIQRWPVEVTFHEVRTHLGVETQRQWSPQAIARTTPILLGLFSWVTLLAHQSAYQGHLPIRQAAWYQKPRPTFVDALALVRRCLWQHWFFGLSGRPPNPQKLVQRFLDIVCYSA